MNVFYLNDERQEVDLFTNGLGVRSFIKKLAPSEGILIDIDIPEGNIPFIKKWPGYVMIAYGQEKGFLDAYEKTKAKDPNRHEKIPSSAD